MTAFASNGELLQLALWLVLAGFVVVLVSDLIGNFIAFDSRVVNALVTATVFTAIFGGIVWVLSGRPEVIESDLTYYDGLALIGLGAVAVFISDFIGNHIAFGHKVVNALVTATVFALLFGGAVYYFFQ